MGWSHAEHVSGASPAVASQSAPAKVSCSIKELTLYFFRLGALGFGGPIALTGYMQRDLVEEKRWISKEEYLEGLALAQLAPGPLAAQLAIYLGWVRGRLLGATLAGFAFVVPSFFMVVLLAYFYLQYGGLAWMQGVFYGVGAGVIGIIVRSSVKLVKLTLTNDRVSWAIFLVSGGVTAWTESEIVWLFLMAGIVSMAVKALPGMAGGSSAALLLALPDSLVTGLHGPTVPRDYAALAWFFTKAGTFVFGSGLAIVPFLYGGVVQEYAWLNDRQFLDAVAVAMITPGPVVITVGFIGYLAAGPLGAVAAAIGTFLPCYLFVVLPAPYVRRLSGNRNVKAFATGITAAATGAIAGAAFVLGKRAIVDVPTAMIACGVLAVLWKVKKLPEPLLIAGAAVAGVLLKGVGK